MKRFILVCMAMLVSSINPVIAQNIENGEALFGENCASCHGDIGQGGIGPPLTSCGICGSLQDLITKIEQEMPPTDPTICTGDCAVDTAAFIFSIFNAGEIITDPIPQIIEKGTVTIRLETVASGLAAPIDLKSPDDGTKRLFVVDQAGKIMIIQDGKLLETPFLDVTGRMVSPLGIIGTYDESDYDERGLLGVAFHPGFADPSSPGYGSIYTHISEPVNGASDFTSAPLPEGSEFDHQGVIAEWQVDPSDPNRINPDSYREVMRIDQPQFNHNGGTPQFGPDGYLYIPLGDGGASNDRGDGHGENGNGQNIGTVHGSILRIDPLNPSLTEGSPDPLSANGAYRIPVGNPFVNATGVDEIYAYGFRNPFRISFDRASSELVVADVGQNEIEEVDLAVLGGNYGWNLKEGSFTFVPDTGNVTTSDGSLPANLIDPVIQYDHDEGISVIGGFVYRGSLIPELEGRYVFGDFSTSFSEPGGRLFYSDLAQGTLYEFRIDNDTGTLGLYLKGFGSDSDGEIYVLGSPKLGPYGDQGVVLKIVSQPEQDTDTGSSSGCFIRTLL